MKNMFVSLLVCATVLTQTQVYAGDTSPEQQIAEYAKASGAAPDESMGREFFMNKHGHEWSCSSCHTSNPAALGKHATTGKAIQPMAPAYNPNRFTDHAKTEKWFRRNCNDVLGRECAPGEKANFLAWLNSIKH